MNSTAVQALLALSDERDQWRKLIQQAWRDGYAAGRADESAERDEAWNTLAEGAFAGITAPYEDRHYPPLYDGHPGGRDRFADPRPGDFQGRATAEKGAAA